MALSWGRRTHGMPSEYTTYFGMIARCCNPNHARYADYGGRGITVCQRWLESFKNFIEDMGPKPTLSHTIERENNDLGYGPENCIWQTRKMQCRNTRRNKFIEFEGVRATLAEWEEITGIRQGLISERLRRGLCASDCLSVQSLKQRGENGAFIRRTV